MAMPSEFLPTTIFEFEKIIFDETLINAIRLAEMEGKEPIERQGQVRWFKKPKKGLIFLMQFIFFSIKLTNKILIKNKI